MKSNEVETTLKHPESFHGNIKNLSKRISFYFKNLTLPLTTNRVCQENERAAKMTKKKKSIFELIGSLFDGPTIFTKKIAIFWRSAIFSKNQEKIANKIVGLKKSRCLLLWLKVQWIRRATQGVASTRDQW